jgi:hypothetical protein
MRPPSHQNTGHDPSAFGRAPTLSPSPPLSSSCLAGNHTWLGRSRPAAPLGCCGQAVGWPRRRRACDGQPLAAAWRRTCQDARAAAVFRRRSASTTLDLPFLRGSTANGLLRLVAARPLGEGWRSGSGRAQKKFVLTDEEIGNDRRRRDCGRGCASMSSAATAPKPDRCGLPPALKETHFHASAHAVGQDLGCPRGSRPW